mgnify:CR=1 FL=1
MRQDLAPIRAGKFAIDFTLKAQELAGNGHAFYLPIVWDTYCDTADPDVSTAYNGVVFAFTKTDDGLKLGLANGEKTGDDRMFQNGWPVIDTCKTLHIVVEPIDGTTSVYIDGVCYGQMTFTSNSSYLWNGNKATPALGGGATWNDAEGGKIVAVIDTHAPDSTETVQALIAACESCWTAKRPAIRPPSARCRPRMPRSSVR